MMRLAALICCMFLLNGPVAAMEISGAAARPFPALMPLDYAYCRALAWIEALRQAEKLIPATVRDRLGKMDLDGSLARLGLAALACPVEVVTPEITAGNDISVFLKEPKPDSFQALLQNPAKLIVEMCLIFDMEKRINVLSSTWPASLAEATARMAELDGLSRQLDDLWRLAALRQAPDASLEEMAARLDDSPALWLILARQRAIEHRPQAVLMAADNALRHCDENVPREGFLAALIRHGRAMAHWQMDQPALAQADLTAAIALLEKSGIDGGRLARLLLDLGRLHLARGDLAAMCQAFGRACAAGLCQGLSEARRQGRCLPQEEGEAYAP